MVTIKDLVKETGLSLGTVSRYLNGGKLKPKNAAILEQAINRLGYHSNDLARSMKTGKSMNIAIVIPDIMSSFVTGVINNIEAVMENNGYTVWIFSCLGKVEEKYRKLSLARSKRVDGCVLFPAGEEVDRVLDILGDMKVVLVDCVLERNVYDSVTIDNEEIAYQLLKRELNKGKKRVVLLQGPDLLSTAVGRAAGSRRAIAEVETEFLREFTGAYDTKYAYDSVKEVLPNSPELIFAANYDLSVGALNALFEAGKTDIKVIGFDRLELDFLPSNCYEYIEQSKFDLGREAARLLLSRIKNPEKEIENVVLKLDIETKSAGLG